jgi:hypothetical protein
VNAGIGDLSAPLIKLRIQIAHVAEGPPREDVLPDIEEHRLQTTLTPAQEAVAVALRRTLLVSLDDLLEVVRVSCTRMSPARGSTAVCVVMGWLTRGSSARLNSFAAFRKWVSRSIMPPPGLVTTG